MNKFDRLLNNFQGKQLTKESVIDIPRDSLDADVFQFFDDGRQPILKDGIKAQILKDIETIKETVPVVRFYGIGSVFTPNYKEDSDIDINVQVDIHDLDSISAAEILQSLKRLNGKLAVSTQHPINYFCITDEFDWDKAEAVYDIVNERWLKAPQIINPDVGSYVIKFQETLRSIDLGTGELRRNLIDFEDIKRLKTRNIQQLHDLSEKKLEEIEENLGQLVGVYHDVKILRKLAFDRMLTPQEVQMYGSKNMLPENIIYKLLEKYYYIRFLKRLQEVLEERDGGIFDVSKLGKIGKAFWNIQ
jgi:hypothetical protein